MISYCIVLFTAYLSTSGETLHPNEVGNIGTPVLLTDPAVFLKAGESYFDPAGKRVIFQAIEHPPVGESPDDNYGMYLGDLTFDDVGTIAGLTNIMRISKEGSANTCGWFHPTNDSLVMFATTTTPIGGEDIPGYQRESGRYRWSFPPKMNIISCDLSNNNANTELVTDNEHYLAEGSWSPDGRHILYCSLKSGIGDIYVTDLKTGITRLIVGDDGYDGGPFFSPDGKRIAYRSDRRGNDLLQLYVADLAFDEDEAIIGISREFQLSDNTHVNWGPFWHPNGRFIIYATSEVSHGNYELFICDADNGDHDGTTRYGTRKRRVTHADGFDGLPAFNTKGDVLMWTSKRNTGTSQLWTAPFTFDLNAGPQMSNNPQTH